MAFQGRWTKEQGHLAISLYFIFTKNIEKGYKIYEKDGKPLLRMRGTGISLHSLRLEKIDRLLL
jgi:hypothetical protein